MKDSRYKILVIDDDDLVIQSLKMTMPENWHLTGINSLSELRDGHFQAAFVDIHLSGDLTKPEGLKVIEELHRREPHLEIAAISGDLSRELMEKCLKAGATRFLAKPLSREEVQLVLEKIEALLLLNGATRRSKSSVQFIGQSQASDQMRRHIASLKGERGPILIEAESGAGKEVVARLIQEQEGEDRPFITINVAALPENIFESEVFGHVRGAFTGADQNKMGLAEAAHGGDLFLDEIEALPLSLQAKLLRFLESGEVRRVGSKDVIRVNVRVIAATNQNLNKMVREEKFREDLLYRLSGKKILIPPLRERKDDIPSLANYFMDQEKPRRNKKLESDAIEELTKYNWPGNVRELKRVCEQLSLMSPLPIIRREDVAKVIPASIGASGFDNTIDLTKGLDVIMNEFEAEVIKVALKRETDIDLAAKVLGISRSSLYKKIKDYNIETKE